jgi:O-antigen polymerase
MQHRTRLSRDFLLLLSGVVLLFAIAPLYYQRNWGGRGLELPFNLTTWAVATLIICCAMLLLTFRKQLLLPRGYIYFASIPVIIILVNLVTGTPQPVAFFFRETFIVGGLFFFFALFQFKLKPGQLDWILLAIVLSTIVHALIGVLQVHSPELMANWYATTETGVPRGVFQQINVQATFLTTGVIISVYLLSRPVVKQFNHLVSALLIVSIGLNTFVIIYSGSRVGLLSFLFSLLLLVIFRRRQLLNRKPLLALALAAILLGGFYGIEGVDSTLEKTRHIAQGDSREIRLTMYSIALELVSQKPIQGHGIGNYLRVWNLQTGDYFSRNPDAALDPYVEHPHNELVLLMIEGGVIIVAGILLSIYWVLASIVGCGWQRGAGYVAMLLPISFHAQVEQPFYISSVHWFLWLFLIFLVMRHRLVKIDLELSVAANRLVQIASVVFAVGILYFLQHTSRAHADIMAFIDGRASSEPLQLAQDNQYFRHYAEELAMRSSLYHAINTDRPELVEQYLEWFATRLAIRPELKLFEDLINGYFFLDNNQARCEVIDNGIKMYPQNEALQELRSGCYSQ